jgi:hypothetical protein
MTSICLFGDDRITKILGMLKNQNIETCQIICTDKTVDIIGINAANTIVNYISYNSSTTMSNVKSNVLTFCNVQTMIEKISRFKGDWKMQVCYDRSVFECSGCIYGGLLTTVENMIVQEELVSRASILSQIELFEPNFICSSTYFTEIFSQPIIGKSDELNYRIVIEPKDQVSLTTSRLVGESNHNRFVISHATMIDPKGDVMNNIVKLPLHKLDITIRTKSLECILAYCKIFTHCAIMTPINGNIASTLYIKYYNVGGSSSTANVFISSCCDEAN